MEFRRLGQTSLDISLIGLGTITYLVTYLVRQPLIEQKTNNFQYTFHQKSFSTGLGKIDTIIDIKWLLK